MKINTNLEVHLKHKAKEFILHHIHKFQKYFLPIQEFTSAFFFQSYSFTMVKLTDKSL